VFRFSGGAASRTIQQLIIPRTKQELPVSYAVVRFLKHADAVDHYYYHTNFNPFTW
jgi:hypothetical protein